MERSGVATVPRPGKNTTDYTSTTKQHGLSVTHADPVLSLDVRGLEQQAIGL